MHCLCVEGELIGYIDGVYCEDGCMDTCSDGDY